MAVRTDQQQLDDVDAAIEAIELRGQSYTIGDRTFTRASLRTLYDMRDTLAGRVDSAASGATSGLRIRKGAPRSG